MESNAKTKDVSFFNLTPSGDWLTEPYEVNAREIFRLAAEDEYAHFVLLAVSHALITSRRKLESTHDYCESIEASSPCTLAEMILILISVYRGEPHPEPTNLEHLIAEYHKNFERRIRDARRLTKAHPQLVKDGIAESAAS